VRVGVTLLFRRCLKERRFPQLLKSVKVVLLPKSGKRDLTHLKSWRPISLPSTLSKGLERFIARRLAVQAIHAQRLRSSHVGALTDRSAADLVQIPFHWEERAFQQGNVARYY
jgi:hypothetical protein